MNYNISDRINALQTSTTMDIAAKSIEMKSNGIDLIDLSVGEPDFPTPEHIKLAAKRALDNNQTKYTLNVGTLELRQAIAKKLLYDNNLQYSPGEIVVSTGAKQSLFNAIQVLVNEGDEVIVPTPTYVSYIQMIKLAGGIAGTVPTKEADQFKLKPEILLENITPKTKLLILCNPSNPTGTVYSPRELKDLAQIIVDKKLFVLSDEIYEKLIYDFLEFRSIASFNDEIKKRTVVVNGFSKSYSMTGWRIGYAAAEEEIMKNMAKLQSHSTSNASSISQAAALEALSASQEIVEFMRNKFEIRRDFIFTEINKIPGLSAIKPEGAFYLFVNVSELLNKQLNGYNFSTSSDLVIYLLEEAKVSTVPGTAFGAEGFIRISYANSMENLMSAVEKINQAVSKLF
ncbi:MAG: aspartate aminotransferase [Ignavibacteriae bacterium HGW-Ignavibacteriae-2]|jgi:aspartate aminotransferase|nr:MAG: aspartate aminotransferase [Ignavibacteriae bacterium HGW-Ignavibacteriae-2]